jgi:hypothetical protein
VTLARSQKTKAELEKDLRDLEDLIKLRDGLPHILGQKFYPWARRVWDSTNPEILVCSANQVGKSSIAIRKNILLATEPKLWTKFWPNLAPGTRPNLFWYFYPTMPVANTEFETKWEPLFLPRGEFRKHPIYGWTADFEKGNISRIKFNSGVQIQFKAYSQKVKDLQTASVYHATVDEELPIEFLPELKARLNATEGLFLMVFTATLGQIYWQMAMEPSTKSEEKFPNALKIQVSLFDSKFFDDGTPSPWTDKKINRAIANCPTEAEIQRRVYGRFVKASGLVYEAFSITKNMCDPTPIPKDWVVFSGVDPGSGGQSGHPASIIFVAASQDFKQGRVFRGWRGDGIPTASSDILDTYRDLKKKMVVAVASYDFAAADFYTVASRMGEPFVPANKKRDAGIGLLNTLFKMEMLKIHRDDPELEKLVQELCSVGVNDNKRTTTDDLSDALRYAVMAIPWNLEAVSDTISLEKALEDERIVPKPKSEAENRRAWFKGDGEEAIDPMQDEFDFWNENSGASEGTYE